MTKNKKCSSLLWPSCLESVFSLSVIAIHKKLTEYIYFFVFVALPFIFNQIQIFRFCEKVNNLKISKIVF